MATVDCVAIAVTSVDDAPTFASFITAVTRDDLGRLDEFSLDTEGTVSIGDLYNREYMAIGVNPGSVPMAIWGNHLRKPGEIVLEVRAI